MSISELTAKVKAAQQELVAALQAEYFTDDVEPPAEAFGWSEDRLREFFESGGDDSGSATTTAAPTDVTDSPTGDAPLPSFVLLGDSITALACRSGGAPAVNQEGDPDVLSYVRCPPEKDGPGWVALLKRDYASFVTRVDVLPRGQSAINSRLYRQDLENGLLGLPQRDVRAVTLMLGSNDHVREKDALHVPVDEYESNLVAILTTMRSRYPDALLLLCTPPPCDEAKYKRFALDVISKKLGAPWDGSGRGETRLAPYVAAAKAAAAKLAKAGVEVTLVDVHAGLHAACKKANLAIGDITFDGLHMTGKGDAMLYEIVAKALKAAGKAPMDMPPCRPAVQHRNLPALFDAEGRFLRNKK